MGALATLRWRPCQACAARRVMALGLCSRFVPSRRPRAFRLQAPGLRPTGSQWQVSLGPAGGYPGARARRPDTDRPGGAAQTAPPGAWLGCPVIACRADSDAAESGSEPEGAAGSRSGPVTSQPQPQRGMLVRACVRVHVCVRVYTCVCVCVCACACVRARVRVRSRAAAQHDASQRPLEPRASAASERSGRT